MTILPGNIINIHFKNLYQQIIIQEDKSFLVHFRYFINTDINWIPILQHNAKNTAAYHY
jgi:hypothetical protein